MMIPHISYVSMFESPKNGERPVRRTYVTTPTDLMGGDGDDDDGDGDETM